MDDEKLHRIVKNKRRPDRTRRLSDVLTQIMDRRIAPQQNRFGSVAQLWEQLLPPRLVGHCRIIEVSGGTLNVAAETSAYANELRWASEQIIEQLQINCPKARIRTIKVTIR